MQVQSVSLLIYICGPVEQRQLLPSNQFKFVTCVPWDQIKGTFECDAKEACSDEMYSSMYLIKIFGSYLHQ